MAEEYKTISQLLYAYHKGQRHFIGWDFAKDGSIEGLNLEGITFENCFLFLDFRKANLANSKFIRCNIKTADFSGANLKDATIKGCAVESIVLSETNVEDVIFEDNGYYGITLGQEDLETFVKCQSD